MNTPENGQISNPAFWHRLSGALTNPTYRLYLAGTLGQFAAMTMNIITGPLLIYRLTGSSALLGTMALVSALPMIVISVFGGAVADRIPKKRIVIAGLLASAIVSCVVALALMAGYISKDNSGSWWVLIASALCMGSIMGFMMPALQAMLPEIVSRDKLMNAVAINMFGLNVLSLGAPALAGFMIDSVDFHAVYFTQSGLYVLGAVFIFFVKIESRVRVAASSTIMEDIGKGFSYIRKDSTILGVLGFTLVGVMLSMPYQQLLPIFVDDILKVGATGAGMLMSVAGLGAMAGSFALASMPDKKRGLIMLLSGIVSGIALTFFAFSETWGLTLGIIVFVGLGQAFRLAIGSALLQGYTEAEYMGRVLSIFNMQWGFMSVCTFFAGIIAEVIPVQWVVGGLAMTLVVISILALAFFPGIRRLD